MHTMTDFRARGIIYKSIFRSFCDDLATSLRVYLPFDFPLATSGSCVYFRAITLIQISENFDENYRYCYRAGEMRIFGKCRTCRPRL